MLLLPNRWIQSVYVPPQFRQQGHFKSLYKHVREEAQKAGAAGLRLYADVGNERAHAAVSVCLSDSAATLLLHLLLAHFMSRVALCIQHVRCPSSTCSACACSPMTAAACVACVCVQYERLGMTSHYKVYEEMFTGY